MSPLPQHGGMTTATGRRVTKRRRRAVLVGSARSAPAPVTGTASGRGTAPPAQPPRPARRDPALHQGQHALDDQGQRGHQDAAGHDLAGRSCWPKPSLMITPRPPPPTSAARVAVATTWTAAVRTPAAISGTASGSSTRSSTAQPDRPIPRAASTTSGSTSRMPT